MNRKTAFAAAFFVMSGTPAAAQPMAIGQTTQETGLEGAPVGPGLGIALGDPAGIALSMRPGDWTALQGTVGWSLSKSRLHLSADYLRNLVLFESESTPELRYPLYVGIGGRLLLAATDEDRKAINQGTSLGLRVPVGIGLLPRSQALDVYFEVAPVLLLLPDVKPGWDATLGARIYPWGRGRGLDEDR